MSQNIMIAGCNKDERDRIEASVRAAFTGRPDTEPWNVSLVRLGNQWSIDINGPEPHKGITVIAEGDDLTGSLERAIGAPPAAALPSAPVPSTPVASAPSPGSLPAPAGGGASPASAGPRKDRHECEECAAQFEVLFDKLAGEPEDLCPVACPACWHVNRVPIAEAAGATGDYRAQSAG